MIYLFFLIIFINFVHCERFELLSNTLCTINSHVLKDDYININSTNNYEIYETNSQNFLNYNIYMILHSPKTIKFKIDNINFVCDRISNLNITDLDFLVSGKMCKNCALHYLYKQYPYVIVNYKYSIFDIFRYQNVKLRKQY
jgi:hypothetical protein